MSAQPPAQPEAAAPRFNPMRSFLTVLVASLGIAALLGLAALFVEDDGEILGKVLASTVGFSVFSATGLASAVRLDRREYVVLGWAGLVASVLAFAQSVIGIWSEAGFEGGDVSFWRPLWTLVISAFFLAHASLVLLMRPRARAVSILRAATLVCLALMWALIVFIVWVYVGDAFETLGKVLAALGILTVFGTLATPISNRLAAR